MFRFILKRYFSHHGAYFLTIIIIVSFLTTLAMPYLSGLFIDFLLQNKSVSKVVQFALIIMIVGIFGIIVSYLANLSSIKIITKTSYQVLKEVVQKLERTQLGIIEKLDSAYLTQRAVNDTNTTASFVISNYVSLWLNASIIIVTVWLFFKANPRLLIILMILIPTYIVLIFKIKKLLYKANMEKKERESVFFNTINQQISHILDIKINAEYEQSTHDLNDSFDDYFPKLVRLGRLGYIFSSIDGMISILFQSIMFVFGGISIIYGTMTLGEFTMINAYFAMIIRAIKYYIDTIKAYQDANASFERICVLLNYPNEIRGQQQPCIDSGIIVDNLNFTYDHSDCSKPLFDNFSCAINPSGLHVIVGANGTGKTTLVKLILGLYPNYDGNITYTGTNIRDIDTQNLRRFSLSVVPQNLFFSSETVREFISRRLYVDKNKLHSEYFQDTEHRIPFTSLLEELLDTSCQSLSGGEARKLALWVAFQKASSIIILDEPTTSLDTLSCNDLIEYLIHCSKTKSVIVCTHDSMLIEKSEYMIELKVPLN